jgi:general secretion pathway protein C
VSGTIVWSITFANRAIITDPQRRQRIYYVGDRLADGSELAEIHPDEVIVRRDNRLVTLPLSGVASPEEAGPDNATLEADVREVREILLEHPEILASVIEAEPIGGSGPGSGFRIIRGAARTFLAALGLEPGDIVSAVNGIVLNGSEGALHTLTSLAGAHVLELSIWRRGQLYLIDI